MKNVLIVLTASAVLLTGCATGGSVGDMAIGDDSTAVKAGRNRAEAQLSRSELEQHRRQRTNVSEELDLEQKKRSNKQQQVGGAMGTIIGGAATVGAVAGTVHLLKSIFSAPYNKKSCHKAAFVIPFLGA